MGLRLTTKVQVSGWRFLLRRLEHAIVRRDTRMFDDPLQFYSRSIALGIVVAVLILAGAALLAYFKPQGKLGGTSLFTDRATNQLYVLLSGQLHPVYNLTSARLVLGNPANPATVKSSELSKLPMGQTVGIPGAPYATPVSAGSTSIWTPMRHRRPSRLHFPGSADRGHRDAVGDRCFDRSAPVTRSGAGVLPGRNLDRHN